MRAWVAKNPVRRNQPGSPGHVILSEKPSIEVNFEPHPEANPRSRSQNLVRWQRNPEKDWGPKPRAKKASDVDTLENRRLKNQGKRKRKAVSFDNIFIAHVSKMCSRMNYCGR